MRQTTLFNKNRASLISHVDWRMVGRRAAREVRNREIYAPVVSVYRWWARRPHSVMGAILDAAVARYGKTLTVSDPFSGGGTVTFEAARRGLRAYAQDLYPWPARGLTTALQVADPKALAEASRELLTAIDPLRSAYRRVDGRELSHILRVRKVECRACAKGYFQFPHRMLSLASRRKDEKRAFFGCAACGTVVKRSRDVGSFACSGCHSRWTVCPSDAACPHCRTTEEVGGSLITLGWNAALVQELAFVDGRWRAALRLPSEGDPIGLDASTPLHPAINMPVPAGKETNRLIRAGFGTWQSLYSTQQATILTVALAWIRSSRWPDNIQDRLAFAVLGACEMPAFVTRWDRVALKPFETMSNHRYFSGGLSVEANYLSPVGRGTLPRRLKASQHALKWLAATPAGRAKVFSTPAVVRGRRRSTWDVLIATGSSERQALADRSVDLVLTDPPYFDDVQYGELARLFHVWLSVYAPATVVEEHKEAVPNTLRGVSAEDYRRAIMSCLLESRRTLKPTGRLVLTFHNKKIVAWHALARAIRDAGFSITSLAVVRAESDNDHCKRDVAAMLSDLVIECAPRKATGRVPKMAFTPKNAIERNLAAMGHALACSKARGGVEDLRLLYRQLLLRRYGGSKELVD